MTKRSFSPVLLSFVAATAFSLLSQVTYLSSSSLKLASTTFPITGGATAAAGTMDIDAPFASSFGHIDDDDDEFTTTTSNNNNKKNKKKKDTKKNNKKKNASTMTTSTSTSTTKNCLDPNGPIPVVLMSLGRSGSSSVWDVMGNLTGQMTRSEEYTGKDTPASQAFFENIQPVGDDSWLLQKLCQQQQKYPNAGLVGFKWKPNNAIHHPTAQAGLKLMADLGIKAVRSTRNELDVIISREKHVVLEQVAPGADGHGAHCTQGDTECMQTHQKMASLIELDPKTILRRLRKQRTHNMEVDEMLTQLHVPHVSVSYDELYFSNTNNDNNNDNNDEATEWKSLFNFIQPGLGDGLTNQKVKAGMTYISTSSRDQQTTMNNFKDIANVLRGTEFEGLLRSASLTASNGGGDGGGGGMKTNHNQTKTMTTTTTTTTLRATNK